MIIEVVGAIGAPWTILLLAADSVLGALLFRSQGRAVWSQFNEALATGPMPHREVVDGVLVIFGGAFLITPGFITDIFGLLMLLPPTRALIRRLPCGWSAGAVEGGLRGGRRGSASTSRAPPPSTRRRRGGSGGDGAGAVRSPSSTPRMPLRDGAIGATLLFEGTTRHACSRRDRSWSRMAAAGVARGALELDVRALSATGRAGRRVGQDLPRAG